MINKNIPNIHYEAPLTRIVSTNVRMPILEVSNIVSGPDDETPD